MRRFATMCLAKGVDALIQEFNDLKISCPTVAQLNHTTFDKYPDKNRYKSLSFYCFFLSSVCFKTSFALKILA